MNYKTLPLGEKKRIALIAHDNKKQDLIEWAKFNRNVLADHIVLATGTTGKLMEEVLKMEIIKLQSGPLGGINRSAPKLPKAKLTL